MIRNHQFREYSYSNQQGTGNFRNMHARWALPLMAAGGTAIFFGGFPASCTEGIQVAEDTSSAASSTNAESLLEKLQELCSKALYHLQKGIEAIMTHGTVAIKTIMMHLTLLKERAMPVLEKGLEVIIAHGEVIAKTIMMHLTLLKERATAVLESAFAKFNGVKTLTDQEKPAIQGEAADPKSDSAGVGPTKTPVTDTATEPQTDPIEVQASFYSKYGWLIIVGSIIGASLSSSDAPETPPMQPHKSSCHDFTRSHTRPRARALALSLILHLRRRAGSPLVQACARRRIGQDRGAENGGGGAVNHASSSPTCISGRPAPKHQRGMFENPKLQTLDPKPLQSTSEVCSCGT
jgi:hypothetical protein